MSEWSERDLALIGAVDEIIIAPDQRARTPVSRASGQRHTGEARQRVEQVVLEVLVANRRVRRAEPLVEPVSAAAARLGFVTGGKPFLG